jgi:hypothetical protein
MDDQQVGVQARLMSKALRKITGLLNKRTFWSSPPVTISEPVGDISTAFIFE